MKSTIVGPYTRVGSDVGDTLRKELNKFYIGKGDQHFIQSLKKNLTLEVMQEMVSTGIQLPNTGLIDVHDEITWPLESADGVDLTRGMKKIFHTNTHYREAVVNGEVLRKAPIVNGLYHIASQHYPQVKVELPGPYTMAQHSVLGEKSPYRNLAQLVWAYARMYREELAGLKNVSLVQFNEPSVIAFGREHPNTDILPDVYAMMLKGSGIRAAVWTYYGKYDARTLDILLKLPVDVIGLDFVWDQDVDALLKKRVTDKGIGIGVIDSGDQGFIRPEDQEVILRKLKGLEGYLDFDKVLVSSNATLEHLPRDYARQKLALIGEIARRMS